MNPLEIILIILGIIIIAISCKLVDRSQDKESKSAGKAITLEHMFSEQEKQQFKEKLNELLSEISEETVVHTDDTLSKISNEKILAVNDFSDQILEKIKRNHEEVVFLYNMLSDKEKELKAAVREIDSSKKKVQDIIESKKAVETEQNNKKTIISKATAQTTKPAPKNIKQAKPEQRSLEGTSESVTLNSLSSNNNTQILSLYSQGKSVIEISKLLGLGQGEVKLVIDLFKGKK